MRGSLTGFWSKLQQDERRQMLAWHPLADHCADVAVVSEELLERTLLRPCLAQLVDLDDPCEVQVVWLGLLAAVHDPSKVNLGCQSKVLPRPPLQAEYVAEVLAFVSYGQPLEQLATCPSECLDFETLLTWVCTSEALRDLQLVAFCNHGRPVDVDCLLPNLRLWNAEKGLDLFVAVADLLATTRLWFPRALCPGGELVPSSPPPSQRAWSGLMRQADWLGSDVYPERFCFRGAPGDTTSVDRMYFARSRAGHALARVGLDPDPARASLGAEPPTLQALAPGRQPWPSQEAALNLPLETHDSMSVLEVETGRWKTEATLIFYVRLFYAGLVDGLVFAPATLTSTTQVHRRVVEAVEHTCPDRERRPAVVLAVPGYIWVDQEDGLCIPRFAMLWSDNPNLRHRVWAAERPRRNLAGLVVGILDQVLLSALRVSHTHVRATALMTQLLVVNKVHASDSYMDRVLYKVLDQVRQARGHVLPLSATLASNAKTCLLAEADLERRQDNWPSFVRALNTLYPAVTHWLWCTSPAVYAVAGGWRRKSVGMRPWNVDPAQLVRGALEAEGRGAAVLVIRNTVRECRATPAALEAVACGNSRLWRCHVLSTPHRSRCAAPNRTALGLALKAAYGRRRPPGGRVAVAAQTAEQSLDLDADLLLTGFCPVDMLQRCLDRLVRHQRDDHPAAPSQARAQVLVPADDQLGRRAAGAIVEGSHSLGTVCADLGILEATRLEVANAPVWHLLSGKPRLVENCLHPKRLEALASDLGEAGQKDRQTAHGQVLSDTCVADFSAFRRDLPPTEPGCRFPGKGEGRIPSDLGLDDCQVHLDPRVPSPLCHEVSALNAPEDLARGIPTDAELTEAVTFRFGPYAYRNERLGIAKVSDA